MTAKYKTVTAIVSIVIAIMAYAFYPSASGVRNLEAVKVSTFSKEFINVHLVSWGDSHLLIDTGLPSHQQDIEDFLLDHGVSPADLNAIIVTHAHHDHAGSAAYFQEHFGIKVIAGAGDLKAYQRGSNGKLCPTSLMARARHGMDQAGVFPNFKPDVLVSQPVDLGSLIGIEGKIHNVAAHTPGSLVVVISDSAFVGDLVRGGILRKHSAAMHFYQCDLAAVQAGMKEVLEELAPNANTFFPSHLGPVTRQSMSNMLASLAPQS